MSVSNESGECGGHCFPLSRPTLGYVDNTAKQEGSGSPTGVLKLLSLVETDKTRFQQIGPGELVQQQNTCLT